MLYQCHLSKHLTLIKCRTFHQPLDCVLVKLESHLSIKKFSKNRNRFHCWLTYAFHLRSLKLFVQMKMNEHCTRIVKCSQIENSNERKKKKRTDFINETITYLTKLLTIENFDRRKAKKKKTLKICFQLHQQIDWFHFSHKKKSREKKKRLSLVLNREKEIFWIFF